MTRPNDHRRNALPTRLLRSVAAASLWLPAWVVTATPAPDQATEPQKTLHADDAHYTPAGFFDIHVCNWPDRALFFMPLFSTTRYSEISNIEVRYPDGRRLVDLDLSSFRLVKAKNKPEKHVFLTHLDVPDGAPDGWYSAIISLHDGTQFVARDYVVVSRLPRAAGMNPPNGADEVPTPEKLTWASVGEGSYYQVFIHDNWDDDKLIYTSKLLRTPELALPAGLLHPDGLYSWQIHARNTNEDPLFGDFNAGSMSSVATFSTSAP
ncbi:MAG: hypothetical protein ACWGNB_01590 [Thiogranum sp.]